MVTKKIYEYKLANNSLYAWEIREKLRHDRICSQDNLPSISSINRILRNANQINQSYVQNQWIDWLYMNSCHHHHHHSDDDNGHQQSEQPSKIDNNNWNLEQRTNTMIKKKYKNDINNSVAYFSKQKSIIKAKKSFLIKDLLGMGCRNF